MLKLSSARPSEPLPGGDNFSGIPSPVVAGVGDGLLDPSLHAPHHKLTNIVLPIDDAVPRG